MISRPTSDRRLALMLFVCAQLFFALTTSGRLHTTDEYEAYFMAESLVERGELSIRGAKGLYGRRAQDGRFYAPYGPLPAFIAAPGYFAGRSIAAVFDLEPQKSETIKWMFSALTNSTVAAAAVALLFLLARRLGADVKPAMVTALVFAVSTPVWHYATTFFSEPLSATLLLWACLSLTAALQDQERPLWRRFIIAGLPLGLLATVRLTQALLFPIPALALLLLHQGSFGRRIARTAVYCAIPAVCITAYLTWNYLRFGDIMQPGYPDSVDGKRIDSFYGEPFFRGLCGMTFSPGKGLFLFAPAAFVGLLAAPAFLKRAGRAGAFFIALPLIPLAFYANYIYWEGGYCWGPRYLMPTLAFWILPIAFISWPKIARRAAVWGTASAGFLIQCLGISVSFMECQVSRDYLTSEARYNTEYSAIPVTWDVFSKYWSSLFDGRFLAEPEGLGFDRWFFFLEKGGFDTTIVYGLTGALFVLLGTSVVFLTLSLRRTSADLPTSGKESMNTTERDTVLSHE